jgi:ribosome-associated translation inhibitor RaiA
MKLEIRRQSVEVRAGLRAYLAHRLEEALGRFDARIRNVEVFLADLNASRGGVDKQCLVKVHLAPYGTLVVEERGSEIHSLIERLVDRLGFVVGRNFEKLRDKRSRLPLAQAAEQLTANGSEAAALN